MCAKSPEEADDVQKDLLDTTIDVQSIVDGMGMGTFCHNFEQDWSAYLHGVIPYGGNRRYNQLRI